MYISMTSMRVCNRLPKVRVLFLLQFYLVLDKSSRTEQQKRFKQVTTNPLTPYILFTKLIIVQCEFIKLQLALSTWLWQIMKFKFSLLTICICLLFMTEAKNKQKWRDLTKKQRQQLKAWYGPVSSPDECKAQERTSKILLKSEMKPSEICSDVSG